MSSNICAVIPSYNHHQAIAPIIVALRKLSIPIFVVDDGSAEPAKSALAALHAPTMGVIVHRLAQNGGKGTAVMAGFQLAADAGYSHVLQIDADGQHDIANLPHLLELSRRHPDALIAGAPIYDQSVPLVRKFGRWLTHFWVWIETLSFQISDSMCGYRIYPLERVRHALADYSPGRHMDFDIDIIVRLSWAGVTPLMTPVKVTYPVENISNFDPLKDNWRITKLHTRLFFTMLLRLPSVLANRPKALRDSAYHWASVEERGTAFGLALLAFIYRLMGRKICRILLEPGLLYFFLTGSRQRRGVNKYWRLMYRRLGLSGAPGRIHTYRQFRAFGDAALDKFGAWMGDIRQSGFVFENDDLDRVIRDKQGILVIASHIGNIEMTRALSKFRDGTNVTVFAHTENAAMFNNLISKYNPQAAVDIIEVADINPGTVVALKKKLALGEWVIIAADRMPVKLDGRVDEVEFLGETARLSQGPILLAALLKCPVYLMACMKEGDQYRIYFDLLSHRIELPRRDRDVAIAGYLKKFARYMEEKCEKYPYQWYNFFDFWAK